MKPYHLRHLIIQEIPSHFFFFFFTAPAEGNIYQGYQGKREIQKRIFSKSFAQGKNGKRLGDRCPVVAFVLFYVSI